MSNAIALPATPVFVTRTEPVRWWRYHAWLLLATLWMVVHAAGIAQGHVDAGAAPAPWPTYMFVFPLAALDTLFWFAVVRLTKRYPIGADGFWRPAAIHAGAMTTIVVTYLACFTALAAAIPVTFSKAQLASPAEQAFVLVFGYLLVASFAHVAEWGRRYSDSAKAALRIRVELAEVARRRAEAELRALKAELNPHFLRNALGTVKSLMHRDPAAADGVLAELGDILRTALGRAPHQEMTLADELAQLEPFIAIERTRLGGRLTTRWEIDDAAAEALVPDMLLQPLVESVIRRAHGRHATVTVTIRAARARATGGQDVLDLRMEVGGVDVPMDTGPESDRALANVRSRLAELYGNGASLTVDRTGAADRNGIATQVRVGIPWHEEEADIARVPTGIAELADHDDDARAAPVAAGPWKQVSPRRLVVGLLYGAAFVAMWAGFIEWMRDFAPLDGSAPPGRNLVKSALIQTSLLFGIIWIAIRVSARYPIAGRRLVGELRGAPSASWRRTLGVHLLTALACGVVAMMIRSILYLIFGNPQWALADVGRFLFEMHYTARLHFTFYVLIAAVVQSAQALRRLRRAESATLRMAAELATAAAARAQAELRALKVELNPHFIGNALGAVSALMRNNPKAAEQVLDQITDLVDAVLARARTHEVTLREELQELEPFVAVERARLGGPLELRLDVAADTLDVSVPHMILQPLVENAVKHGLRARPGSGRVEVAARRESGRLKLAVRDDGVGLAPEDASVLPLTIRSRRRVGLENVQARLFELYGGAATFELGPAEGGGTIARLDLPLHHRAGFAVRASGSA